MVAKSKAAVKPQRPPPGSAEAEALAARKKAMLERMDAESEDSRDKLYEAAPNKAAAPNMPVAARPEEFAAFRQKAWENYYSSAEAQAQEYQQTVKADAAVKGKGHGK